MSTATAASVTPSDNRLAEIAELMFESVREPLADGVHTVMSFSMLITPDGVVGGITLCQDETFKPLGSARMPAPKPVEGSYARSVRSDIVRVLRHLVGRARNGDRPAKIVAVHIADHAVTLLKTRKQRTVV